MNDLIVFDQTTFNQRNFYETPNVFDSFGDDIDLPVDQFFMLHGVPHGE